MGDGWKNIILGAGFGRVVDKYRCRTRGQTKLSKRRQNRANFKQVVVVTSLGVKFCVFEALSMAEIHFDWGTRKQH